MSATKTPTSPTTNGLPPGIHYHNVIKSTGQSAVYQPSSSIINEPLSEKYEVGESIGRGKFAVVKKITNRASGDVLAAKLIKKRRRGKSCREEILREVVMLEMALDHPRLVNLREVYETQQELILITEYCAGGELFTECILEEKFVEADVRILMMQIIEGLVYLHEKKIVHLDLKPQNILLTDEFPKGSVKICDLGFACLVNTGEDIRDIIGTPDYVAPEVLNYDPLGLYTDMWSLGVLTYVMLTTCSPFAAEDKNLTFANITTANFDFPDDLFAEISPSAVDFIKKLLILNPSERMNAQQCLEHAWITGGVSPSTKQLNAIPTHSDSNATTHANCDTLAGETAEQTETTDTETSNSVVSVQTESSDSISRNSESEPSNTVSEKSDSEKSNLRKPEFDSQYSEMSVCEEEYHNTDLSDRKGSGEPNNKVISDLNDVVKVDKEVESDSKEEFTITEEAEETNIPDKMDIVLDNIQAVQQNTTEDLNTPDTESSIGMSDNQLEESDSGMVTASDFKSESDFVVTVSGRSSTDIELSSERDLDMGYVEGGPDRGGSVSSVGAGEERSTEVVTVVTMECSSGDPVAMDTKSEVVGTSEQGEIRLDQNFNCAINQRTESESSAMEQADAVFEEATYLNDNCEDLSIGVTLRKKDMQGGESSKNDSGSVNTTPTTSKTNDQPLSELKDFQGKHIFQEIQQSFSDFPVMERLPKGRSSLGSINETIHSMQIGEKHKRAMSSDPSTSTGDSIGNEEEVDYEFISVSKRVRSYEENLNVTPPYSPKLERSPKISRSPRIARHSRQHHHH